MGSLAQYFTPKRLLVIGIAQLILTAIVIAVVVATMSGRCTKTMDHDERALAEKLFARFWTWRLQNAPEFATSIGNHEYDGRLDEMSLPSYDRRSNAAESFLVEVNEQLSSSRDPTTQLNLNLLRIDLEMFVEGSRKYHTNTFPINQLEGPHVEFPRLVDYAKKKTVEDYTKLFRRFEMFPLQIEEMIVLMRVGIERGWTMHEVSIVDVPKQIRDLVDNSKFMDGLSVKPSEISTGDWDRIVESGTDLVNNKVLPAYMKLADFLDNEYMNHTRPEIAASSLPDGPGYYQLCLQFHTSTNWSAQEIHDLGVSEVTRITEKMKGVMNEVKYGGTLDEFKQFMKTDAQFKFTSAEGMLSVYNNVTSRVTQLLPSFFKRTPSIPYKITEVPPEIASSFPTAYYLAPPADGSRPGVFYLNTHEPTTRATYDAVALSLHEAEPGHHLQSALTMEQDSLVDFRRFMEDRKYYEAPSRFAINTAYVEGWGLYSEYLGEEMGLYSDPYDMFGRLSYEMLRACRLVVDTGMHALGWTREQAIEYMAANIVASGGEVETEIDRYITWPGQACGYKVGELKIKQLRNKAEEELGSRFDVGEFHDLVASIGGVPMSVLEAQVDQFILYRTV